MRPTTEAENPKLKALSAILRVRKKAKRRKKGTQEDGRSECR